MDDIKNFAGHAIDEVRLGRWLFSKLPAWLVPLVPLAHIYCFLLDVANDDTLNFWASLPVFCHQPGTLISQLSAYIRHRVAPVKLASMSRCMHHEVLLRDHLALHHAI